MNLSKGKKANRPRGIVVSLEESKITFLMQYNILQEAQISVFLLSDKRHYIHKLRNKFFIL